MLRRTFIKNTSLAATALSLGTGQAVTSFTEKPVNKLPKWKGFNLLDFFSPDPSNERKQTSETQLKWMQDWGFDFVRIPIAYPYYLDIDRKKNITAQDVYKINPKAVDSIDSLVSLAQKHGMHVSLNLHRAPGYCVNAGFNEPYNLWKDAQAQEAFNFPWNMWAKRYKNVSSKK